MWQTLTNAWREFGLGIGSVYLIDQALIRLSDHTRLRFYELMVQPITEPPLVAERYTRSFSYREIKAGDPEVDRMPARSDIKATRFEQGARCLGAFRGEEFVGYMWFTHDRYLEDEVRCVFDVHPTDSTVFDFDFYLFPEYRMGLAFIGLWEGANRYLYERGIRYTYSRITRFNTASRRAHDHLGWRRVGRAVFLKLWNFEWMIAGVKPYVHVSISPHKRVQIDLYPEVFSTDSENR
jgi:hypothetical protein